MKSLQIETASLSYPVFIGGGIRKNAAELLSSLNLPMTKLLLITDEEVDKRYGEELFSLLRKRNGPSKRLRCQAASRPNPSICL